MQSTSKR